MSRLVAIPYYIDGPRSLTDAAIKFNNLDKSDKIFSTRKGLGSFVKSVIGRDFSMTMLKDRDGFIISDQISERLDTKRSFKNHIRITEKGCGKKVNAVLIILEGETLIRPERLISLYTLSAETPTYLNVEIGFNKLSSIAKEHLGIK